MTDTPDSSFEKFLDVLVAERILDLNHAGLIPRLVSCMKESYRVSQISPLSSQSAAAAIFLKASLLKDSYRKCGVKPIFTPKETQKYLKQRHTIVDWFKRAKSIAIRRDSDPQSIVDGLTHLMRYVDEAKDQQSCDRDDYWNCIITGDKVQFSDSDDGSPADSSIMDVDEGSCGYAGTDVMARRKCFSQEESSTHSRANSDTSQLQIDRMLLGRTIADPKIIDSRSMSESQDYRARQSNDDNPCKSGSNAVDSKLEPVIALEKMDDYENGVDTTLVMGRIHLGPENSYVTPNIPPCIDQISEGEEGDGLMMSAGDDSTGTPDIAVDEGSTQDKVEQLTQPTYYINSTIILYGYANLVTQCYYIIKQVFDRPMSELVAYPEHMRSRHSFLLWQNPCLQHICCKELSFALSNNEITFGKLSEILMNKKSKCCVLENVDLLPLDLQIKIAKYLQKNERLFILLTRRLSHVISSICGIALSVRVPSVDVGLLVQAATAKKFSPNIFAGLSRNSILEHIGRAREDIHLFYRTMLALQQKRNLSIRRDSLSLRRIVHYITFQDDSLNSKILLKKSVHGILSVYMRDPFIFWLDFLEEFQAAGSPEAVKAKERFHHLIAQKSALLSQVNDPRVTLEVMFHKMMHIFNSGCTGILGWD